MEWDRPTKTFQTKKVRQWLKTLELGEVERLAMSQLLKQWSLWDEQIRQVDAKIKVRFEGNEDAKLLATMYGVSRFIADIPRRSFQVGSVCHESRLLTEQRRRVRRPFGDVQPGKSC